MLITKECRGRNGWFSGDRLEVLATAPRAGQSALVRVEVTSNRAGDVAPIVIQLTVNEALHLARLLERRAAAIQAAVPETGLAPEEGAPDAG